MPFNMIPHIITGLAEARIATKRLEKYLLSDEIKEVTVADTNSIKIKIKHATFEWPNNGEIKKMFKLNNIKFTVKGPSLVGIVGGVGSGKSSFLNSILGEIECTKGSIKYKGKIAYSGQTPYIQNATLRDNILFGNKYNEEKYKVYIFLNNRIFYTFVD